MKHHGANPLRAAPLDVSTCYACMRCEYHPFNSRNPQEAYSLYRNVSSRESV